MEEDIIQELMRLPVIVLMIVLFAAAMVRDAGAEDGPFRSTVSIPDAGLLLLPETLSDPFDVAVEGGDGSAPSAAPDAGKKSETPSVVAYGKDFFPDLWDGTKRIYSPDIGPVALIGIGVTGLSFVFDHSVDDHLQKQQPLGKSEKTGDRIGQGYVPIGLGVALFATGEVIDNKQLADTGAVSLQALAVTGVATEALKYMTQRQRPNHVDNMSFPSGHASMTAAFAASVSEMYDWNPYLAVPLFAASAFVGASRIQAGEHHFSDVAAGITLGTVVGMGMGRSRKEKNTAESRLSVMPYYDGQAKGVVLNWRF